MSWVLTLSSGRLTASVRWASCPIGHPTFQADMLPMVLHYMVRVRKTPIRPSTKTVLVAIRIRLLRTFHPRSHPSRNLIDKNSPSLESDTKSSYIQGLFFFGIH